jgi:hypothetical protein
MVLVMKGGRADIKSACKDAAMEAIAGIKGWGDIAIPVTW